MEGTDRISFGGHRPLFVVIEGIDGAGKTTQAMELKQRLEANRLMALVTREPSGLPVGCHLRDILEHRVAVPVSMETLALLFAADRLDHLDREINPALNAGSFVISDRYTLSSVAYQGTLTGDPGWVRSLNRHARVPDLLFFLDLSVEEAIRRRSVRASQDLLEEDALQKRVAAAYRAVAQEMNAIWLDGTCSKEQIAEHIFERVLNESKRQE